MRILVTGAAGFIGYHTADFLLSNGHEVVGVDNLNDYYDPELKHSRLNRLAHYVNFIFEKIDLSDRIATKKLFQKYSFDRVIHLAAQAGVRYSVDNPETYIDRNLVAFGNMLEGCRQAHVAHLIFASSSSVYGLNEKIPFSVHDGVDHPVSLYAATKRSNELMAHAYSHQFNLPVTGLRFFTVYGPWDRPDMALQSFTQKIYAGEPIEVFHDGELIRDWTYIDDIVRVIIAALDQIPTRTDKRTADPATSWAPFRIYNVGGGNPIRLKDFITHLEEVIGKKAQITYAPLRPEDVLVTCADPTDTERELGCAPQVSFKEGLPKFIAWFKQYYKK